MTIKNQSGFAFPLNYQHGGHPMRVYPGSGGADLMSGGGYGGGGVNYGLTKREYFAVEAMKGLLSGNEVSVEFAAMTLGIPVKQYNPLVHWVQYIAKRAVAHADALFDRLDAPEPAESLIPEETIATPSPTEAARPIEPVEGMYQQDETGET